MEWKWNVCGPSISLKPSIRIPCGSHERRSFFRCTRCNRCRRDAEPSFALLCHIMLRQNVSHKDEGCSHNERRMHWNSKQSSNFNNRYTYAYAQPLDKTLPARWIAKLVQNTRLGRRNSALDLAGRTDPYSVTWRFF